MSNYRPLTDTIFCARTKTKYYGAYPAGFLEKARIILGCSNEDFILHICGGKAKEYNGVKGGINLTGFGKNDLTMDIDPLCQPDITLDVRELASKIKIEDDCLLLPKNLARQGIVVRDYDPFNGNFILNRPKAILVDRPYTLEDADHYRCGREVFPELNQILKDSLEIIPDDGLVGILDYKFPSSKKGKCIGVYPVIAGTNCRIRVFTVWRKI